MGDEEATGFSFTCHISHSLFFQSLHHRGERSHFIFSGFSFSHLRPGPKYPSGKVRQSGHYRWNFGGPIHHKEIETRVGWRKRFDLPYHSVRSTPQQKKTKKRYNMNNTKKMRKMDLLNSLLVRFCLSDCVNVLYCLVSVV